MLGTLPGGRGVSSSLFLYSLSPVGYVTDRRVCLPQILQRHSADLPNDAFDEEAPVFLDLLRCDMVIFHGNPRPFLSP